MHFFHEFLIGCVTKPIGTSIYIFSSKFLCYVLNPMAHDQLKGLTPIQDAFDYTPDVSAILYFLGIKGSILWRKTLPWLTWTVWLFVGISKKVDNALTFFILTNHSHEVLCRSGVWPFCDDINPNICAVCKNNLPPDPGSLSSPVYREN